MQSNGNSLPIIEALIVSSPEPLPARKIAEVLGETTVSDIDRAVTALNEKYMMNESSFRVRQVAGGYQLYIIEDYAGFVEDLLTRRRNLRLTRSALETLAIIAYRQPVTKIDIEMIRGVASDSVLHTLMERKLITLSGRAQSVGRPLLYRTTGEFLKYFSLNSLDDLPKMQEIEELLSSREPDAQQQLPLNGSAMEPDDAIEPESSPDVVHEIPDRDITDDNFDTDESGLEEPESVQEK
ncbi:Segregation and condensation protein ScpB (modular protein) [Candidatus Zixiibacteriota bacterium]|nr:Segregation and condensation protein ScpB (modular protein) [candidate division Zixibacteria bacterium]